MRARPREGDRRRKKVRLAGGGGGDDGDDKPPFAIKRLNRVVQKQWRQGA